MKKRFLPTDYIEDRFLKLQSFMQETLSVEEYVAEFERLTMLCDLEEKVEHKIARYITGLRQKGG